MSHPKYYDLSSDDNDHGFNGSSSSSEEDEDDEQDDKVGGFPACSSNGSQKNSEMMADPIWGRTIVE
jgi:hypothetical protein